jgi:hypothetical protein
VACLSAIGGEIIARTRFHRCVCHRAQSTRFETNNQPFSEPLVFQTSIVW